MQTTLSTIAEGFLDLLQRGELTPTTLITQSVASGNLPDALAACERFNADALAAASSKCNGGGSTEVRLYASPSGNNLWCAVLGMPQRPTNLLPIRFLELVANGVELAEAVLADPHVRDDKRDTATLHQAARDVLAFLRAGCPTGPKPAGLRRIVRRDKTEAEKAKSAERAAAAGSAKR